MSSASTFVMHDSKSSVLEKLSVTLGWILTGRIGESSELVLGTDWLGLLGYGFGN